MGKRWSAMGPATCLESIAITCWQTRDSEAIGRIYSFNGSGSICLACALTLTLSGDRKVYAEQ